MNRKENIKILLVDDEPDILEILRYNFCASGYQVTAVTSAEEALTLDLSAFDLIILDLMLGGMSGERLTMLLKENPLTADIPLIMLTAKNAREDIIDGLRLGVDDYVSKPFSVQELLLRAQAVLRRSRRPASRDAHGVRHPSASDGASRPGFFTGAAFGQGLAGGRGGDRPERGCEHHPPPQEAGPVCKMDCNPSRTRICLYG